jgi:type IV pilus assembly protein PilC
VAVNEYICKLGTSEGRVIEKVCHAETENAARQWWSDKDFFVFSIRKKGLFSFSLGDLGRIGGARKKIKTNDFLIFNQEFIALVKAGLPILHGLGILSERMQNPHFKRVLGRIRDEVESGTSLSEAFEAQGGFSRVYTASLMAGERSGDLVGVIRRYVDYLKIVLNIRRKVVSAMVYPVILVALSMALISIMILYVIPNFQTFYTDFDAELPMLTQVLMAVAFFSRDNIFFIIGAIVLAVIGMKFYERTAAGGIVLDRVKMRVPLLGPMIQKYSIAQMCRTLATLLGGGIPLLLSLEVASKAIGNRLLSREVGKVVQQINEGQSLADSLERTGLFTGMTVEMVRVGETSGALTEMLSNVADFYDEEVDNRITVLISMLEPALLISMGLVIAGMLLAMYLPLFEAINAVHT